MRDVLARWRARRSVALDEAPEEDREALLALYAARVLLPAGAAHSAAADLPDPAAFPLAGRGCARRRGTAPGAGILPLL